MENEHALQSGPCIICNRTDYPLSYGGPDICPTCDCGKINPVQLQKLKGQYDALIARVAEWKKAIEGLTPNGSEFVNDPTRCAEYIRITYSPKEQFKTLKAERETLKARVAQLEAFIIEVEHAASSCVTNHTDLTPKYWRDRARAALKTEVVND